MNIHPLPNPGKNGKKIFILLTGGCAAGLVIITGWLSKAPCGFNCAACRSCGSVPGAILMILILLLLLRNKARGQSR